MRTPRPQSSEPWIDPAEDEASMASLSLAPGIEAIAAELRAKHYAERRGETEEAVRSKVSKWNSGKARPQGGGHR